MNDDLTRANAAVDLPEIIGEYFPASGARAGRQSSLRAVWRNERNPSASVFKYQGIWFWKDHGSAKHGNTFDFFVNVCGFSKTDAANEVKRRAGMTVNTPRPNWQAQAFKPAPTPIEKPPLGALSENWYEYLHEARERLDEKGCKCLEWYGLSVAQACAIGLGRDTDGGLIIPIYTPDMELTALKKRYATKNHAPRYTYPTTNRGAPAWISGNISAETQLFVVVEGEMNAITLHLMFEAREIQAGVIGMAGTNASAETLAPLLKNKDVLIYADGDEVGKEARAKWFDQILKARPRAVAHMTTLEGVEDFADLHRQSGTEKAALIAENWLVEHEELLIPIDYTPANLLGAKQLDLISPIPDVKWVVKNMIPEARITILASYGGTGKSTLITYLTSCLNTGTDFLGYYVTKAPVMIVDYEDEVNTFRRWAKWVCTGMNFNLDTSRIQHVEVGTNPIWQGQGFPVMVDKIIEALPEPTVIIIDAFESAMQIDSNKAPDVLYAMAQLNRLARAGHTIIVLDHLPKIGKGQSKSDVMPTGSVQKVNQARSVLMLEDVTPANYGDGASVLALVCKKMNLAKKFETIGIERTVKNERAVFSVCDLSEILEGDTASKASPTAQAILDILEDGNTVALSEIVRRSGMDQRGVRRTIEKLEQQGQVRLAYAHPAAYQIVGGKNAN